MNGLFLKTLCIKKINTENCSNYHIEIYEKKINTLTMNLRYGAK